MTQTQAHDFLFPASVSQPGSGARTTYRRRGLVAGVVAGPLFLASYIGQATVRDGFDPQRHPISALSTGGGGWVQILTFVVTGLCVIAAGLALGRVIGGSGGAGRWGARLVMLHGVGLVAAGVFGTDPSDGFPVGTPRGLPDTLSWHAQVHNVVSMTAFAALLVACLLTARPVGRAYGRAWRRMTILVPVAVVAVMTTPVPVGMSLRLAAASALVLGWLAALSRRALAHH